MADNQNLRAAVAGLADDAEVQAAIAAVEGTEDTSEAPTDDETAPPEASEGEDSTEVTEASNAEDATEAPEGGTAETDVPDTYFGIDLSDLDVEARQAIIDGLQKRDTLISQLMQRNSALEKGQPSPTGEGDPSPAASTPAQPAEPTDDQLLEWFGLNANDPLYEVKAEVLLPVAKRQYQLEAQVNSMVQAREAENALAYWDSEFDRLEQEFGELPVSRDVVIEYALDNNILDPATAFHTVTATARKMVSDEATKARQEALKALKAKQQGELRPARTKATPKQDVTATDLKTAVEQAAKLAENEVGATWASLLT